MRHKARSEHELSGIPPQSSYSNLPHSDDAHDVAHEVKTAPTPNYAKDRNLLRPFRLQFVGSILTKLGGSSWNAATEHRKVAIYQNRSIAATHSLLHVIPFAAAVALLTLQWTRHWFAAKIHELAMQASIIEVLLCLVRNGLINDFVPLGALSGAIQPTQLSYLWSFDFFSLFKSHALQGWRRIIFLLAVPALVSLTSLVGPSSAVLMIPRPNSSRIVASGTVTRYSNKSTETLYPNQMGAAEGLTIDLPSFKTSLRYSSIILESSISEPPLIDYDSLMYQDVPNPIPRVLRVSRSFPYPPLVGDAGKSNATIPTTFITHAFMYINEPVGAHRSLTNGTRAVIASHPVAGVQCWSPSPARFNTTDTLKYWRDDWTSTDELSDLAAMIGKVSDLVKMEQTSRNRTKIWFSPIWTRSPEPSSDSSVAIFFSAWTPGVWNGSVQVQPGLLARMLAEHDLENSETHVNVTTCTTSAHWITSEIQQVRKFESTSPYVTTAPSALLKTSGARPITLNFTHSDTMNTAVFHEYMGVSGETIAPQLARVLAVALGSGPEQESYWETRHEFFQDLRTPNSTAFHFVSTEYGYGYGARSTSVYLAMAVILFYCTIIAIYILYILTTGSASTAWSSGVELFALALQSRKPDHLGHVSVGIDSINTFSEGVGIRVNTDNELEIVFANDRDFGTRRLRKAVRNKEY